MNLNTAILLWFPMAFVLFIDYVLLKYIYNKQTSIERILKFGNGTKLDLTLWLTYYVLVPKFGEILLWTTAPGLFLLGLVRVAQHFGINGIFAGNLPKSDLQWVVLWLLAIDFARYASHILLHKIPALWEFHRVHHASNEFNVIVGNRVSLAEKFFHDVIQFGLLSMIIGLPAPYVIIWVLLIWNTLNVLEHSDLPWDYGWLGYVFVSPRFHRAHHSSHKLDIDNNFGTIFSFWDYLFGTVSPRYRADPAIADECELGLTKGQETEDINEGWLTSALNGTGIDYALRVRSPPAAERSWKPKAAPEIDDLLRIRTAKKLGARDGDFEPSRNARPQPRPQLLP